MTNIATSTPAQLSRVRLQAEFGFLFVAVPVAHVVFFDTFGPFLPLGFVFVAAAALLAVTPGYRWISVIDVRRPGRWLPLTIALSTVCAAVTLGIAMLLVPERMFDFPRYNPDRFLLVISLYPFLSVLGQEVAYRLLFFERYRGLFANDWTAIAASAFFFALAHAFYFNWVAVILSFAGGLAFAWAYVRTRSFPAVWIFHSIAGQVLFASGLGVYFYHGAIPR